MAVHADNPALNEAIRTLAALTGEPEEFSVQVAVAERLERLRKRNAEELLAKLRRVTSKVAAMPVLDDRTDNELLDYNEHGTFE